MDGKRKNILVFASHVEGEVLPVTYELAAFAKELSRTVGAGGIVVAVICDESGGGAREISEKTGMDTINIRPSGQGGYTGEACRALLDALVRNEDYAYVCAAHDALGLDVAPGLAIRIGGVCVTGVDGIGTRDGEVTFYRQAYGGKLREEVTAGPAPVVLTVQPGAFSPSDKNAGAAGKVTEIEFGDFPRMTAACGFKKVHGEGAAVLSEAGTIVAAGRGIGDEKNLELVCRFAECFPGAAVAGSRPMIDSGWMEYARQVGLTGATVSPDLYVACGISGSSQHVAGMRGSKFIVAINSDPGAAIFNVADVCIVEDVLEFMKAFNDVAGT